MYENQLNFSTPPEKQKNSVFENRKGRTNSTFAKVGMCFLISKLHVSPFAIICSKIAEAMQAAAGGGWKKSLNNSSSP